MKFDNKKLLFQLSNFFPYPNSFRKLTYEEFEEQLTAPRDFNRFLRDESTQKSFSIIEDRVTKIINNSTISNHTSTTHPVKTSQTEYVGSSTGLIIAGAIIIAICCYYPIGLLVGYLLPYIAFMCVSTMYIPLSLFNALSDIIEYCRNFRNISSQNEHVDVEMGSSVSNETKILSKYSPDYIKELEQLYKEKIKNSVDKSIQIVLSLEAPIGHVNDWTGHNIALKKAPIILQELIDDTNELPDENPKKITSKILIQLLQKLITNRGQYENSSRRYENIPVYQIGSEDTKKILNKITEGQQILDRIDNEQSNFDTQSTAVDKFKALNLEAPKVLQELISLKEEHNELRDDNETKIKLNNMIREIEKRIQSNPRLI
jgi:hypothetical protein